MDLNELIKRLETLKAEHGNRQVIVDEEGNTYELDFPIELWDPQMDDSPIAIFIGEIL